MSQWTRGQRFVGAGLVGMFLVASTACYGPFNLTRNVYHWNSGVKGTGEINDKWMREFVFFGMIIVPVYMFSALLDAFVFNSIQFWTGDNPVKATDLGGEAMTKVARLGDRTIRWMPTPDGATVLYERKGMVERRAMIVAAPSGYRLVDEAGVTLAEAEIGSNGTVTLLDGQCRALQTWSREELARRARS